MTGLSGNVWKCVSASTSGARHAAQGLPCQDAHGTVELDDGTLIVAVADGAGSARRSDEGSRCAVRTSTGYLRESLERRHPTSVEEWVALLDGAVEECRGALDRLGGGKNLGDFATTLLLTVITDLWLATIQVGDGAVLCRLHSGELRVLSSGTRAEYINETTFLTSQDYRSRSHKITIPSNGVSGLAMFTDGIELLAIHAGDNTAHVPFFDAMFEFAGNPASSTTELQEFLESERVCERTDDDKTLVLALRNDAH